MKPNTGRIHEANVEVTVMEAATMAKGLLVRERDQGAGVVGEG